VVYKSKGRGELVSDQGVKTGRLCRSRCSQASGPGVCVQLFLALVIQHASGCYFVDSGVLTHRCTGDKVMIQN
jgi:hypothetical protein